MKAIIEAIFNVYALLDLWAEIVRLLLKSAFGLTYTAFDRGLADLLEDVPGCPEEIHAIANMQMDTTNPDVWLGFWSDVTAGCSR